MAFETNAQRAQAAQAEISVVGPFMKTGETHGAFQRLYGRSIGRDGAEHHIGMAADIFGAGLDDEIDAVVERAEIKRGRPGIVHQHQRAFGMYGFFVRGFGDRGDVLHFERERAGQFQIDGARVRPDQLGDRAADARIVVSRADAEPRQDLPAKSARRPISAVGDEDVIAGMHDRQQRRGNRREPRR